MKKYIFILIAIIFVSCVEETIVVSYPLSIIQNEVRGYYTIIDYEVGKTWGTCNQYICKNQDTDELVRVFSTCTSTCFDIGDNVILVSGCDIESNNNKIKVRTRQSLELNYKALPIVLGTIIMIDDRCESDIDVYYIN